MLIGIFSDCHCGYKFGEERGEDSFIALNEAMDKVSDCDVILIAGDMFDTRIPRPEVFAKVARILGKAQNIPSRAKFLEIINKEKHEISPSAIKGIPIVAIHGTHERRSKYLVNPIEALEHAGLLIHLHCATAVFEIDGKKVAVHGMSGVPDKYAKDCMDQWNPQPVAGATNILMFHNSVTPYIYSPLEPPSMQIENLPKGFDLYVLGHIHWQDIKPLHTGKLLLCGSTVATSVKKIESEQPKSIFKYEDGALRPVPLEFQRKIFYKEFDFDGGTKDMVKNFIETLPSGEPKPIINIKIKGMKNTPVNFRDIEEKFGKKAVININKESESMKEQLEAINSMKGERLSPEEHGLRILNDKLKEFNCEIKVDEIFEYLVQGEIDQLFGIITGQQQTFKQGLEKWTA
jgi:DNA repair exonuclease SbcCD nuclease subunit